MQLAESGNKAGSSTPKPEGGAEDAAMEEDEASSVDARSIYIGNVRFEEAAKRIV